MSEESAIVIKATDRYSETVKRKDETTKEPWQNGGHPDAPEQKQSNHQG